MADDFLSTYAPLANDIAQRTNIDPSVVLGIIDTETGHGVHVSGNNIFGISPSGPRGQYVAGYPDVQTASNAFINLMQTPRYAPVAAASDPASQAAALVKSGYNTANPNYASIVANKALSIGKQLGYQDDGQGGGGVPTIAVTSSQPAPDYSGQPARTPAPAAPAPDYNTPAAAPSTAKDRVAADPDLQPAGTTQQAPAQGSTAKDRLAADPDLQPSGGTTTTPAKSDAPAPAVPPASAGTVDEYGNVQVPLAAAPPAPSLDDVRSAIQQGDINALKYLAPGPDAGPVESAARKAAMLGVHVGAKVADIPLGMLAGAMQGPSGITWNPRTGTYGATPELQSVASLGAGGLRFSGANPLEFVPPSGTGTFFRDPPIPSDVAANLLTPEARARAADVGGSATGPSSSTGIPTPPPMSTTVQPAGAQVSSGYEAIHTPAEEAAYRATAEGQKLLEPQKLGEPDLNQYIPGETVNNAEREQTAKAARELKELGIRVPEASDLDKQAAEGNNTARTIYAQNTAKGPVEILNENVARQNDIEADKATVFAPENVKGPVDLQPVIDHMTGVLNKPFNLENTALQQAYRPWLERLQGFTDGKIDNPEQAWGLRYDMDQQTDKFAQRDNPNMHRIAHNLSDAADVLDGQIEQVAPGYADMLARYKEHSRAIDEMTVLQGVFDKMRGPGQKLNYNDFQRFMKNAVDSRMTPSTDLNPYKAISDTNMQRLWNLRDSLRRTASAKELAQAAGSDTMPNIIDALKGIGKMGGTAALHAYVGAHLGPGGNFALQSLGALGKSLRSQRTIRLGTQQMNRLLRPEAPLRVPPGQENPLSGAPAP